MFQGPDDQLHPHRGTLAGIGFYIASAANVRQPLFHIVDAMTAGFGWIRLKTTPVVLDGYR